MKGLAVQFRYKWHQECLMAIYICLSFFFLVCLPFLNSEALCQNWCQLLSWRNNGLFISWSLTTMFEEVLMFPFARTKSNISPCRRACRSVNDNLAVHCSTISSLVQSVLQALCIILSSYWSNNVGGSTSISFDVGEQELELMVEHTQFFIGGSLPCFCLSHLSMAPHKVVPDRFPLLHQLLCWNKQFNFSTFFQVLGLRDEFWRFGIWFQGLTENYSKYSAGNVQSHLELQLCEMPEPNKEVWLKKSAEFYKFTNFPVW